MYVPLLHCTLKSTSGKAIRVISNSKMVVFREAISTSSPARACSYKRFPSFLIAEKTGGFWSISPINCLVVSKINSSEICSVGKVASISVSKSYEGVVAPTKIVPVYSFSCAW